MKLKPILIVTLLAILVLIISSCSSGQAIKTKENIKDVNVKEKTLSDSKDKSIERMPDSKHKINNSIQPEKLYCNDTDGNNTFVKGTVYTNKGEFVDVCGLSNNKELVTEYICNGKEMASFTVECPNTYVCDDGACVFAGNESSNETNSSQEISITEGTELVFNLGETKNLSWYTNSTNSTPSYFFVTTLEELNNNSVSFRVNDQYENDINEGETSAVDNLLFTVEDIDFVNNRAKILVEGLIFEEVNVLVGLGETEMVAIHNTYNNITFVGLNNETNSGVFNVNGEYANINLNRARIVSNLRVKFNDLIYGNYSNSSVTSNLIIWPAYS